MHTRYVIVGGLIAIGKRIWIFGRLRFFQQVQGNMKFQNPDAPPSGNYMPPGNEGCPTACFGLLSEKKW